MTDQAQTRLIPTDPAEPFLSAPELADRLGVDIDTVYAHARSGALPHYRVGSSYRFLMSEVLEAIRGAR